MKMASFFYAMLASLGILFVVYLYSPQKTDSCLEVQVDPFFDGIKVQNSHASYRIRMADGVFSEIRSAEEAREQQCDLLDLRGLYILPGLIDSHTHIFSYDRQKVSGWAEVLQISAERDAESRMEQAKVNAVSMLRHGFVAIRDLGNSGDFLDVKLALRLKEWRHRFPTFFFSGPGIAVWPTQIQVSRAPFEYKVIQKESEFDQVLAEYKERKTPWIKLYLDNEPQKKTMPKHLFDALIRKAHESGFRVAVHAETQDSVNKALSSKVDSIEHIYSPPSTSVAEVKPYAVLTEIASAPAKERRTQWLLQHQAKIVFGSDAVLDFTNNYRSRGEAAMESLISLHREGLTTENILRAATATAGQMLGALIGQIQPQYQAHLLVLAKSPFEDLNNLKTIQMIIKDGKVFCSSAEACRGP